MRTSLRVGAHTSRTLRHATILSGTYLVMGGVYIVASSQASGMIAPDLHGLVRVEIAKGLAFVAVTAAGLWLLSWRLFKALSARQAELREQQAELASYERRAVASLVASTLVHDLNNMLQVASASAEMLDSDGRGEAASKAERHALLANLRTSHEQMARILEQLRAAPGSEAGQCYPTLLRLFLRDSLQLLASHPDVARCRVELDVRAPELHMELEPLSLQSALGNCVINAAQAAGADGRIRVELNRRDGLAVITVHDNGPGIPQHAREAVLEPFYSTKEGGTGLGLVAVKQCAEQHGGWVEVGGSPLGGASVSLLLPMARAETHADAPRRAAGS